MKTWMVRGLRRLLAWLDPPPVPVAPVTDELDDAAEAIVRQAEALPAGGEYKRHWAYGRLVKQFPDRPRRHIGLAIEQAVARLSDAEGRAA